MHGTSYRLCMGDGARRTETGAALRAATLLLSMKSVTDQWFRDVSGSVPPAAEVPHGTIANCSTL